MLQKSERIGYNSRKNYYLSDLKKHKHIYVMLIPILAFYIIFNYVPLFGAIISFKEYDPILGIANSPWVGFKHFKNFFGSIYFTRVLKNTLGISIINIIFGFPAPILLALMINEVKCIKYKKLVQTATYLPHFISLVVVCSLVKSFVGETGAVTALLSLFGVEKANMLMNPNYFAGIYVGSGIWQEAGWSSIIYLAALSGVDEQLYEAATLDGAGKLRQIWSVTIPCIMSTIVSLLIMKLGQMMSIGYEKIILLYNPAIYDTADVISTYVYRKGIQEYSWSYSTAVGLFNSVVNFVLLILSNTMSKKLNGTGLW